MKRFHRSLILLSVLLVVAACTTPTATPVAVVASPEPPVTPLSPTATLVPTDTPAPTSTFTLEPSHTPTLKPTATSTVTPTATATKIVVTVTPRPTKTTAATTAANASAPASVSASIPAGASLSQAVQLAFKAGQIILGEINNSIAGKGGRCDIAVPQYNLIINAPAYDVSQQSSETQAAYDLYRQGIDRVKATAPKILRVCQGGGAIDKLDVAEAQKGASDAIAFFGRASDLLPAPAPLPTTVAKPTATKVVSSMALSDLLVKTRDQIHTVMSLLDSAQTNLDANFCQQFVPVYTTVINQVTLNDSGRPATWVEQYNAYKVIVNYFQNKLYRAREVCDAGGGKIGTAEYGEMHKAAEAAANAAARAYDQLNHAGLLGQ
ncbi:MAG TPA: hypothetical protein VMP08_10525 [Anaerolineae bacterium]|nr:hypothetical protein [Anaerolineae bacterium]